MIDDCIQIHRFDLLVLLVIIGGEGGGVLSGEAVFYCF